MQAHQHQAPLQPKHGAAAPGSVHASQQGPFSFYPSPSQTSRHSSPPGAPSTSHHAPPSYRGPSTGADPGPTASYAPSFTASQIHPNGTHNIQEVDASTTPAETLGPQVLTLTGHVLAEANGVRGSASMLMPFSCGPGYGTMHTYTPVFSLILKTLLWYLMCSALPHSGRARNW